MSCHHGEREPVGLQAELDVVRMDALVAAAQSIGEIGRGTGGSCSTEVWGRSVVVAGHAVGDVVGAGQVLLGLAISPVMTNVTGPASLARRNRAVASANAGMPTK